MLSALACSSGTVASLAGGLYGCRRTLIIAGRDSHQKMHIYFAPPAFQNSHHANPARRRNRSSPRSLRPPPSFRTAFHCTYPPAARQVPGNLHALPARYHYVSSVRSSKNECLFKPADAGRDGRWNLKEPAQTGDCAGAVVTTDVHGIYPSSTLDARRGAKTVVFGVPAC